jgi:hypothetical protein
VIRDRLNGRLLSRDATVEQFAEAILSIRHMDAKEREALRHAARRTAKLYTRERSAFLAEKLYRSLTPARERAVDFGLWHTAKRRLGQEWKILTNIASALGDAVLVEDNVVASPKEDSAASPV